MPEEHNRVLTDHCSDALFCPNAAAASQLHAEGIDERVHVIGDVMLDIALRLAPKAAGRSLERFGLEPASYVLATLHRPYNVDEPTRLGAILDALGDWGQPVILPQHPRLEKELARQGHRVPSNLRLVPPVGFLDMLSLEINAAMIATDSGGVQKEAYFHGVPCLTLRPETEWTETVDAGWNLIVDADADAIRAGLARRQWPTERPEIFGDGHAAERLVGILKKGV